MCGECTTQQRNVSPSPARGATWHLGPRGHDWTTKSHAEGLLHRQERRELVRSADERSLRTTSPDIGDRVLRVKARVEWETCVRQATPGRASTGHHGNLAPSVVACSQPQTWRGICAGAEVEDGGGGACLTKAKAHSSQVKVAETGRSPQ